LWKGYRVGTGVGIDWGADGVKVVQVHAGPGGVSILSAARVARPATGEVRPSEVAHALARAGIPRRATLGISGRDVMLRYLQLPPAPPKRIRMLVEFELRESMTGGGEVSSDYGLLRLPAGLEKGLVVLAGVAKNPYLEAAFARARAAGVRVKAATPSAVALYRGFIASREYRPGETTLLVDLGRETTEVAIQRDGELYFARNASGGGERLTEAVGRALDLGRERAEVYKRDRARIDIERPAGADRKEAVLQGALREAGEAIVASIQGAVRFARSQTKLERLDFDRLVLSGGGARLEGLRAFLENRLKKPVTAYDPAAALDSSRLRGEAASTFSGAPSAMTVATGLAIADAATEGFTLSILPPREAARRDLWRRGIFSYAATLAAIVLAGVMLVRARTDAARAEEERSRLEASLDELRERARKVEALEGANRARRAGFRHLLKSVRKNRAVLELLALSRAACPEGLNFCKLELGETGTEATVAVELEGRGQDLGQREFLEKLDAFKRRLGSAGRGLVRSAEIQEFTPPGSKPEDRVRAFRCAVVLDALHAGKTAGASEKPTP
jgi:Tfp pilus assembly PilM family ATPase